ncbi:YlqD family protein [Bacillus infantis]|uniref:YlqD family protein n=1 Tax=Bacillus infantis TaxID=324767 RepID=UPI001CD7F604|nr:YlqD family protein [Bacillus infantis]MCA1040750.1 YlqD family protein [Bacillus infantis]
MKILQTATVKQILTEKSKRKLLETYMERKTQLLKECEQLRFEVKKMEKSKKFQQASLSANFEKETDRRKEKIKLLEFQIEQLHMLPLGSELKEKEVQAVVEIGIGDAWDKVSANKTIIIEDGVIKEIR